MSIVTDTRENSKNKSATNRKKFLDRYKDVLKKHVQDIAKNRSIKDIKDKADITIDGKSLDEPTFRKNTNKGKHTRVLPGNKKFKKGDQVQRPPQGDGSGSGSGNSGESLDEFTFTLTKEEFLDIYFGNIELPDFIKTGAESEVTDKLKRAGYTKEGIPSRLNLKKTFENALARKIAAKAQDPDKKVRFLDDEDLRYDNTVVVKKPIKQAVMFCVMDTSGSMREAHKDLAKRFFLLLYLFLEKNYEAVEVVFVKYHTEAFECTEEEFFYGREAGGTVASCALDILDEIIEERYDLKTNNLYIAHAGDGDNWYPDNVLVEEKLNKILPKVQYYAYVEVLTNGRKTDLSPVFEAFSTTYEKVNMAHIDEESEVYEALRNLFEKR